MNRLEEVKRRNIFRRLARWVPKGSLRSAGLPLGALALLPTTLGAIGGGIAGGPVGATVGGGLGALGTALAVRMGMRGAKALKDWEGRTLADYERRMAKKAAEQHSRERRLHYHLPEEPEEPELEPEEEVESSNWPSIRDEVMVDLPEGSYLGKVVDVRGDVVSVDLGEGDLIDVSKSKIARSEVEEGLIERAKNEDDLTSVLDEMIRQDVMTI